MSSASYIARSFFFFFNDTATTEIYTLSLHDALPIFVKDRVPKPRRRELLRQRPLPHPLGQPESPRGCAKSAVQPARQERDLAHRVTVRDDREDRLVEPPAQGLDLGGHDELREPGQGRRLPLAAPTPPLP